MMEALKCITTKLQKTTSPDDASLYLKLFKNCLSDKHSDGSELWLEDVEQITQTVLSESESAQLGKIYIAILLDNWIWIFIKAAYISIIQLALFYRKSIVVSKKTIIISQLIAYKQRIYNYLKSIKLNVITNWKPLRRPR